MEDKKFSSMLQNTFIYWHFRHIHGRWKRKMKNNFDSQYSKTLKATWPLKHVKPSQLLTYKTMTCQKYSVQTKTEPSGL